MSKKAMKGLRDAVNKTAGAGITPSAGTIQEFHEQNREQNQKLQDRVARNYPSKTAKTNGLPISREDWFSGMALQAIIQDVDAMSVSEICARAKAIGKAMTEE